MLIAAAVVGSYFGGRPVVITEVKPVPPLAPASGWSTDARVEIAEQTWLRELELPSNGWSMEAKLEFADLSESNGWEWNL